MKVTLVHPPQATFFAPYLAGPSLKAALQEAGHEGRLLDLNQRANLTMLGRAWLEELAPGGEGSEVAEQAEAGLAALSSAATYAEAADVHRAYGQLDRAYEVTSRAFAPTRLSYGLSMRYEPLIISQLEQALEDRAENPFLRLFEEIALPELRRDPPEVLGIGLAFDTQLVPALTLARMVRRALPEVRICLGGNIITKLHRRLLEHGYLPEGVDAAVINEGETPLLALVDAWQRGADLDEVPNLLWRRGDAVMLNEARSTEDLAALPTPDFDGLALDDYLLPLRLLPALTTRGCYWGRCAFCTHRHGYGHFRMRPRERVVEDLRALRSRYGTRTFFLADEAVPPRHIKALAAAFGPDDPEGGVRWFGDVRFEPAMAQPEFARTMWESGCRLLAFGLESGQQRVLDRMHKGGSPELFADILKTTRAAGIHNVVMFFSGFPGETLQEAHGTMRFIQQHRDHIDGYANTSFTLQGGSAVHEAPERYGVTGMRAPEGIDLSESYEYDVVGGLTMNSAAQIADAIRRSRERDPKYAAAFPREVSFARLVLAE